MRSIELAVRQGCQGVISFGIAGGLAPQLKAGACVIGRNIITENGRYASHHGWAQSLLEMVLGATDRNAASRHVSIGDIAGSDAPVASTEAKRSLHERTGAVAVDTESHIAARIAAEHRLPFAAFRVVTDPCDVISVLEAKVAVLATGSRLGATATSMPRPATKIPDGAVTGDDMRLRPYRNSKAAARSVAPMISWAMLVIVMSGPHTAFGRLPFA